MERVIILIVAYKKQIDKFEEISLKQCFKILRKHPIRLVCPKGLDISHYKTIIPGIKVDFINPIWLESYRMYNKLRVSPLLYEKYSNYEFMLFYELDAFVFRDDLEFWCDQDYDYIGAPWFEGYGNPKSNKIIGVGNGGFSLKKIKSSLEVTLKYKKKEFFDIFKLFIEPITLIRDFPIFLKRLLATKNISRSFYEDFNRNDDFFWGFLVKKQFSWFKIADWKNAMKFSFEVKSRVLFKWNNQELPFGCHAWYKYDLDFWTPFIEREGYDLSLIP